MIQCACSSWGLITISRFGRFVAIGDEIVRLEAAQKVSFANTLERLIKARRAQFVGEEAKHGDEAVASLVAHDMGARYANIEMPPVERERRGIPTDYTNERRPYSTEQRADWNREREDHMVKTALAEAGDAESILILCGREHTDSLALRFQQAGHDVERYDVNQEDWYVENWLEAILEGG
jgi:hypothetical protein